MNGIDHSERHEKTFIEEMRRCRMARNMSQSDLARALIQRGLPYHQQTVAKMEKGTRRVNVGEAAVIADALGVSLASMLGYAHWPSSQQIARTAELEAAVAAAQKALTAAQDVLAKVGAR